MVRPIHIRMVLLLSITALISLVAVACDTEQIDYYLTPTQARPGDLTAIGTQIPPATELPSSTESPTSAPDATTTSTPAPVVALPTNAAVPTVVDGPRPYHFDTSAEALEAALELGCTGWANVTVNGTAYLRACANDDHFEQLVAGENLTPESKNDSTPSTPKPTVISQTPTPTFSPAVTQTPLANITPPPYHFLSPEEASAGAAALGCTGWINHTVEGVSYFRSCSENRDFEIFSTGGVKTLSGAACNLENDPTARFSALPTDLSKIASIIPAGSPAGGVIKPHSYLHNRNNPDGTNVRVPVYAVADSVLTSVAFYGTSVDTSEYLIFFDVTCEISLKFDHISEVAPKIAAVAPKVPANTSQTTGTAPISFEAGELIGYTIGAGGQGAWDFGAYDLTFTNKFANQERYEVGNMTQSIHTVCPYDYFGEPLKSQMYALFGTHDQRLLPNIECTTTERDVLGAASGAWFDSLDLEFSDSKVSLGMLPGDLVTLTGIGNDVRIEKGQDTWLDPDQLTTSHCYFDDGRWFFLEILDEGMQLALASGGGGCPASMPAGATIYYR